MRRRFHEMHRTEIARQTLRRYELLSGIYAVPWVLGFLSGLLIFWPIVGLPVLLMSWWLARRIIRFCQRSILGVALRGWRQYLLLFLSGLIPAASIVTGHASQIIIALPLLISAPLSYFNWKRHRRWLHLHVAREYIRELPVPSQAATGG